jgi:hypothetical protein
MNNASARAMQRSFLHLPGRLYLLGRPNSGMAVTRHAAFFRLILRGFSLSCFPSVGRI